MQASSIRIGGEYAVNVQGKYSEETIAVMVTEISTVKGSDGTKSYITGWTGTNEDRRQLKNIPVKDVVDDLANHERLAAEKAKAEEERKAKQKAREEKQWQLCQLLAKAIDALPVKSKYGHRSGNPSNWDGNWDMALVFCDGSSIMVNDYAFDKLDAFLNEAMPTHDGMGNPIEDRPNWDVKEGAYADEEKAWDEENYTKR